MPSPLLTAATSTFEALALLFPDVPPAPAQCAEPLSVAVRVGFTGPFAGTLDVAVTDDVAVALAANMLGFSPDTVAADATLRRDALGELANVVCGNVLPLVGGREAVFHLSAPVAHPVEAVAHAVIAPGLPAAGAQVAALGIETGRAVLALHVDDPTLLVSASAAAPAASSPVAPFPPSP